MYYQGGRAPNPTGAQYLISCTSFGEIGLTNLNYAFLNAVKLVSVPSTLPTTSTITNTSGTFFNAYIFNQDISTWDVSNVTDMSVMFNNAYAFNQNLTNWNVSNVTLMYNMFYCINRTSLFNNGGVALAWGSKTSKVTNMSNMFYGATSFNVDISSWDVSSVTNMAQMFFYISSFNQNLSAWDVSNVTNMSDMFSFSTAFNNGGVALTWGSKTSKVTNMYNMFRGANTFNQDISGWDVSNVTIMSYMFANTNNLPSFNFNNGGVALNWGTKTNKVTDMSSMFYNAYSFNADINSWDVSNVTDMSSMFTGTTSFNKPLNSWNVSSVINMNTMFNASIFNQPLNNWDVSNVTNMSNMFLNGAFNQNIGAWGSKTSKVINMSNMFAGSYFNQDLSGLNFSSVTNMSGMFADNLSFNQNINTWNAPAVQDISSMFNGALAFDQDISGFNISNVAIIDYIFDNSGLSTTNYNNILNYWATLSVQPGLNPSGIGLVYSPNGLAAHNTLANAPNNWIFSGDAYISSNTLSPNIPFTFTVNANDRYSFYQPDTFNLSATNLLPVPSTVNFDGTVPNQLVFSNLTFTTGGNNISTILTAPTSDINYTYYLDVTSGPQPSCFMEGSKILTSRGYIPIENIRKGDLIKTVNDGYIPVNMIGKTKLYNSGNNLRSKEKLYLCSAEKYIELTEDLIITGCHGILVDEFENDIQKENTIEAYGRIFTTDGKYRLPACVDPRAVPYDKEGVFNIWHLALDHDNYYMNYGIYANGLLVETCSKRYLKELSGMDLVE